jgi:hypothetical protein
MMWQSNTEQDTLWVDRVALLVTTLERLPWRGTAIIIRVSLGREVLFARFPPRSH